MNIKSKITEYISILCEILFFSVILGFFIYLCMNSGFFPVLFSHIAPVSVYLFSFSLLIAAIIAVDTWTGQDRVSNIISSLPPIPLRRVFLFLLTISVCISLVPVFTLWSTANYQINNIGGTLPMFDAGHYYQGAEEVLHIGVMDSVNQRRPLYTLFFSVGLLLTNFNYQLSILLQAVVFGISGFLASYAVARTYGRATGCVMFAALLCFSAIFLPESLTENIGITMGCISFVLLWYGITEKKYVSFLSGIFFLTIALMSRAGPMLLLPALMIIAGYLFKKKDKTFNWLVFGLAGVAISAGAFFNQILVWLFGDGTGMSLSNFSMTLYGLASGGKGWMQYQTDFPYLTGTETHISAFLYDQSLKLILNNPLQFLGTLLNKLMSTPIAFFKDTFQSLFFGGYHHPFSGNLSSIFIILFSSAILIGLYLFFTSPENETVFSFFAGAIVATWLSLPFIYDDAPFRSLAVIFPIIAAVIAIGTLGWRRAGSLQRSPYCNDSGNYVILSAGLGVSILFVSILIPVIGPGITGILMNNVQHGTYNFNSPPGGETFIMRIDTGIPYIRIVNESIIPSTFAPQILRNDFSIPDWIINYYKITGFPDDEEYPVFFRGYDELSDRSVLILAPEGFIYQEREIVTFRAICINCQDPNRPGPLRIYRII
jgi:hypothetical protein